MNARTKKPIHKRKKSTSLILQCIVLNLLARLKSNTVSYNIIDIKSLALDAVKIRDPLKHSIVRSGVLLC